MIYRTNPNKRIEAEIIGKPLSDYPTWFHEGVMKGNLIIETKVNVTNGTLEVVKVKAKNIYGGLDIGFKDNDYICKGVAKELFICRKAIFEFLYSVEDIKK